MIRIKLSLKTFCVISLAASSSSTAYYAFEKSNISVELEDKHISNLIKKLEDEFLKQQKYRRNAIREEEVLNSIHYRNNIFVIDKNALKSTNASDELINLMLSEQFLIEFMNAYLNGYFIISDGMVIYKDDYELNYAKEYLIENSDEISQKQNFKREVSEVLISNNDFKTESHWYGFGYKRMIMTNEGRIGYLTSGKSKTTTQYVVKATYKTIDSTIKVVRKILAKTPNVHIMLAFIIMILAFIAINITTLVLSYNALLSYNSGTYIGYFALTGTITNGGKK